MHGGLFLQLRQSLAYARPWQQLVIGLVAAGVGIGLMVFGRLIGVLPVLFGGVLVWRVRAERRSSP